MTKLFTKLNKILEIANLRICRLEQFHKLLQEAEKYQRRQVDFEYLLMMQNQVDPDKLRLAMANSRAQIHQDVHALIISGFKRNGFFVEFGAGNGRDGSNTYLLEKEYGWNGIVSEPARVWRSDLKNYRDCSIDERCVWKESGELLKFRESSGGYLSGLVQTANDIKGKVAIADEYHVLTISLKDLLDKYAAPRKIDYLSIDTEGSEFEILNAFRFDQYEFRFITCEHNRAPIKEEIRSLLKGVGYIRIETPFSFEDWFTLE